MVDRWLIDITIFDGFYWFVDINLFFDGKLLHLRSQVVQVKVVKTA